MCGIAGVWGALPSGCDSYQVLVHTMADTLRHRGPDDNGEWVDEAAGIALGHRRLAVVELSPAGHQPMLSASGRWVIVFNGEIYNHLELRQALGDLRSPGNQGPDWRGRSDTETLLACFDAWGVEATLKRLVGMFAIALWDRETRTLTLARDRLGEKPLYYGWQGPVFLFGSELKALRRHPAFNAEIDRGALSLLLRHNYVPGPHSIYRGIYKLPAGSYLQIAPMAGAFNPKSDASSASGQPVQYWSLGAVAEAGMAEPFSGSDQDAIDLVEQHLNAAVRGQMLADVPLGALLSGGIDSTLVAALMQSNSAVPVKTFTIGFDEREYDEAIHARHVARHLGTDHTELRLTGTDSLELVPGMASMYDEPFADSSQLPTHLVMKLARRHVTVALSGDGGDELFGGYKRYFLAKKFWKTISWMPFPMRKIFGAALLSLPVDSVNRLAGLVSAISRISGPADKLHKMGRRLQTVRSMDDLYVSLMSEWPDPTGVVQQGCLPANVLDEREAWPRLADPLARMMALDGLSYLPDDILVKVDRAAMAASLETRAPFLDHRLAEFAWSLPMHMKIRSGQGKWLLRRLLDKYVPRDLVDRPKMGFGIPLDDWLRGPLRDWAETLLAEARLRREGFFQPEPIRDAWHMHQTGRASCCYRLWSVLMFQAWLESSRA